MTSMVQQTIVVASACAWLSLAGLPPLEADEPPSRASTRSNVPRSDGGRAPARPYVIVLGTAQDGGYQAASGWRI